MQTETYSTEWLLEQWALWAYEGNALGYPKADIWAKQLGSSVPEPTIEDDIAGRVDQAVARLKKKNPEVCEAVVRYFLRRQNYSDIERGMKLGRNKGAELVRIGVACVDCYLEQPIGTNVADKLLKTNQGRI